MRAVVSKLTHQTDTRIRPKPIKQLALFRTGIMIYDYFINQATSSEHEGEVHVHTVDRGTYVYQPGDKQTVIHLITRGVVKIGSYSPNGERVIYDVLQPGEFFGDLNYLDDDGVEFFEFARTITRVTLLSIDLLFFRHLIVHDPVVSDWFNGSVVRRWWKAETRLLHMTRGNIETRLANLRKEYEKPVFNGEKKGRDIFSLLSHQDIADLTGTTRQTVSKKLKEALEPIL